MGWNTGKKNGITVTVGDFSERVDPISSETT